MFKKIIISIFAVFFAGILSAFAHETADSSLAIEAEGVVGQAFILDGSRSTDDGTVRTFSWKQVEGPVAIRIASGAKVTIVPTLAGTYEFELIATDRTEIREVVRIVHLNVNDGSQAQENAGGTEDINIGIGENKNATPQPSSQSEGNVEFEWKVEEGESGKPKSDDRLVNAGPTSGWPDDGIQLGRDDVNGLTEEEKTERLSEFKAHAEIKSGKDLENFAGGVLLEDVRIKGVKIKENLVEVDYQMPGKLLGFIPLDYQVKVIVAKDNGNEGNNQNWDFGRAKVRFPWYSFLLKKGLTADEISTELQQAGGVNVATGDITGDGTDATEAKAKATLEIESYSFGSAAQTFTTISNVLKTKHDTAKNSINNVR